MRWTWPTVLHVLHLCCETWIVPVTFWGKASMILLQGVTCSRGRNYNWPTNLLLGRPNVKESNFLTTVLFLQVQNSCETWHIVSCTYMIIYMKYCFYFDMVMTNDLKRIQHLCFKGEMYLPFISDLSPKMQVVSLRRQRKWWVWWKELDEERFWKYSQKSRVSVEFAFLFLWAQFSTVCVLCSSCFKFTFFFFWAT